MRINTLNPRADAFGLTGREFQEKFDDMKYKTIAAGSEPGKALYNLANDRWTEWLQIVEEAPWLRNWRKSPLWTPLDGTRGVASCPRGEIVEGSWQHHRIATYIFTNAIWGYGMLKWLTGNAAALGELKSYGSGGGAGGTSSKGRAKYAARYNRPMTSLLEMQGVKVSSMSASNRVYFWDDKIYRGCGVLVPYEYGDLDRWLEPMWQEVQYLR